MIYEKIPPHAKIKNFVHCYYCWEYDPADVQPFIIQSPPSGYEALVFNYGYPYRIRGKDNEDSLTPSSFFSGQNTANYQLVITRPLRVFGIVLQPAAFASLFRVGVKDAVDRRIALDCILGKEGKYLELKMQEASNNTERVRIAEQYLLQKIWLSKLHPLSVNFAVNLIDSRNGLISVEEIANEVGTSRRSLERDFMDKVGISPKFYTRLRRFAHISYLLMYHKMDWHDLVNEGSYVDQSHLIRDFQFFNGRSPVDYLLHNRELIRYLEK